MCSSSEKERKKFWPHLLGTIDKTNLLQQALQESGLIVPPFIMIVM